MNIFLTGGTGYIGSRFLADVHNIHTIRAGIRPGVRDENFDSWVPFDDSIDPETVLSDIDVFVHLAALTPHATVADKDFDEINRAWPLRIAEACMKHDIPFIFASTSDLYPDANGKLLRENDIVRTIADVGYVRSKFEAEKGLQELAAYGLKCCILRFGSTFGNAPGTIPNTRLNRFVKDAVMENSFEVFSELWDELRPYTYVGDASAAIRFFLEEEFGVGDIFHVPTKNATTRELVEFVQCTVPSAQVMEREGKLTTRSFGFDDTRIRSRGFVPKSDIMRGIKELAQKARL